MASKGYSGFINRLVAGSEKSEGYARASLPSNRWELFWDIFKGRFGKLIIINFLTLLFFIPLALVIGFRYVSLVSYGTLYPFGAGFGVGYQAPISMSGLAESIVFTSNVSSFLFLPIALIIAAIGLSGGLYVMRNMAWTEGVFIANDFWRGIKQNAKQFILIAIVYSIFFYLTIISSSLAQTKIASGVEGKWLFYLVRITSIVLIIFTSVMVLFMLSMSVTYEYTFFQLVRNAFFFMVGSPITSVVFIVLGGFPFAFMFMGEFMIGVSVLLLLLFAFSLFMLVWTIYSQWLFDRYLNDRVKGAQKNRGIYEKVKKDSSAAIKKYKEQIESAQVVALSARPIKPITDEELTLAELPESFSRKDIETLNESRRILYEDNERYIAEHINDEKFLKIRQAEQNVQSIDEERQKRIEKAKKELEKRNKKK